MKRMPKSGKRKRRRTDVKRNKKRPLLLNKPKNLDVTVSKEDDITILIMMQMSPSWPASQKLLVCQVHFCVNANHHHQRHNFSSFSVPDQIMDAFTIPKEKTKSLPIRSKRGSRALSESFDEEVPSPKKRKDDSSLLKTILSQGSGSGKGMICI